MDSDLWRDVIDLQRNWIGEINGARFEMKLVTRDDNPSFLDEHFSAFTHTPEGFYGTSHILVSPQHFLSQERYQEPYAEDRESTLALAN